MSKRDKNSRAIGLRFIVRHSRFITIHKARWNLCCPHMKPSIKSITLPCTFKYNIGAVTDIKCRSIGSKVPPLLKKTSLFLIPVSRFEGIGIVRFCICQEYSTETRSKKVFIIPDAKVITVSKVCKLISYFYV